MSVSAIQLAVCAALIGCAAAAGLPAHAQNPNPPSAGAAAAASPVDDFAKEYRQFKESLTGLPKKIEDTTRSVEGHVNGAVAHQQLSALRAIVAEALKQVADNGPVARMGQNALGFSRRKLSDLQQDTHYTKEQREYLIKEWTGTSQLTTNAVNDLEAARKELADLLKVLQSNEDFIGELETLNSATKTVEAIRDLTSGLREISDHLKMILVRMNAKSM